MNTSPNLTQFELKNIQSYQNSDTIYLRDLHFELEVKGSFSAWADRVLRGLRVDDQYGPFQSRGRSKKPWKEFWITVHAAKHIALLDQSPKGEDVRNMYVGNP